MYEGKIEETCLERIILWTSGKKNQPIAKESFRTVFVNQFVGGTNTGLH